jgi:peptidoglycan lytic transglycosylase G
MRPKGVPRANSLSSKGMRRRIWTAVAVFVLLGLAAASAAAWLAYSGNTPEFEGNRTVHLPAGSSLETIEDSLLAAGVIQRRWTFNYVARATGWGDQIKSGHYSFPSGESNLDVLGTLRRGEETPVRVTIRSGSRKDFVARAVGRSMAFEPEDFLAALRDEGFANSLGTDTTHLFSYLLPDTYHFYWESSPETVIREIKSTFDRFYEDAASGARGPGLELSKAEVTNVAAIVEWEAGIEEEKPTIASVYLNRLRDRWALQADPTIQYAIIELEGSKRRLFNRDYRIQHPYNTYLYRGLPPGPVTNPSRSSIEAVLNPESHAYYFFVARGDGGHIFSRTLGEHRRNANAYYRVMRQKRAEAAREAEEAGSR